MGKEEGKQMQGRDTRGYSEEPCITSDGIDHGRHRLEECLEAMVERYEDGYVLCPILWSGGSCGECYETFEGNVET